MSQGYALNFGLLNRTVGEEEKKKKALEQKLREIQFTNKELEQFIANEHAKLEDNNKKLNHLLSGGEDLEDFRLVECIICHELNPSNTHSKLSGCECKYTNCISCVPYMERNSRGIKCTTCSVFSHTTGDSAVNSGLMIRQQRMG